MDFKDKNSSESHPLFPSGAWEGFYTYAQGPGAEQSKMAFILNFKNNIVTGAGSDEVGSFSWQGTYDTETLKCKLIKHYIAHRVYYEGDADENGIWGMWMIGSYSTGGFHIWPKKNAEETEAVEEMVVEERIKIDIPNRNALKV